MGSKDRGLRCLQTLLRLEPASVCGIVTIDDRADGRSALEGYQELAQTHGLPLVVAGNRRHSEEAIRSLAPQLCLVDGWYWLLGRELLAAVPHGFIGIHPSLLPRYRGAAPLVWSIINGDRETGVSFFTLAEAMDEGDIWAQETVTVAEDDFIADVLAKLDEKIFLVLERDYRRILSGELRPRPQAAEGVSYAAPRVPQDGLVDWTLPRDYLYNFVRAQSHPYPGAFSHYHGQQLTIWRCRKDQVPYYGRPGHVARRLADGVQVICGDNRALVLQVVSLGQGPPVAAGEVLTKVGERL
ncbi:MAG: methionyl-tRNA formyltransferase [Desulfarculus sp.]|nr:methionyl-tRNA formyltransferase [Desulfarculus sp.]